MKEKILKMYRDSAAANAPYGWMNYQPINLPGYEETLPLRGRDCFDRAKAIFDHLDKVFGGRPVTLCDWGCNLGFFSIEAAKRGHVAEGRDADRRFVEICRHLASTNSFATKPEFYVDTLSVDALERVPKKDVLLCFSVLHHLRAKEPKQYNHILQGIADGCVAAYIEMDGTNYGRNDLESFFWKVEPIVSTDDRYGKGTIHRKTMYCTNRDGGFDYRNIKTVNLVHHRGVFRRTDSSGRSTVVKRERPVAPGQSSHTWIRTTLAHEREMYEKFPSPFFPKLLSTGEIPGGANGAPAFRWIEMDYLERSGPVTPEGIDELFRYLEDAGLFVIDLLSDSFIPVNGKLMMVDLESMFPVVGSVAETIERNLLRASHRAPYDTYQKQREILKQKLCGKS